MTFTKAAVWGFSIGFAASIAVGSIKVTRLPFLISVDKKEHLSKEEAAAKINDAMEDRELLFELLLMTKKTVEWMPILERVQFKALTDPQWHEYVEMLKKNGFV